LKRPCGPINPENRLLLILNEGKNEKHAINNKLKIRSTLTKELKLPSLPCPN